MKYLFYHRKYLNIVYYISEIAKYEKKLKELKQLLANKLEIAQSSYSVIQRTLKEISQMVNNVNFFKKKFN